MHYFYCNYLFNYRNIARVEVFKQQILEDGYWEHTKIVNHKWVEDSIMKSKLLNEDHYIVCC